MADIFISYKREEQPIAKKLADALQKEGWTVWWDPEVRAGERFDDVIEKALIESKCVVVLWSKLSVNSQNVKDEATYALNRDKLVPVLIEIVDLPFRFERINTGQLIDWDGSDNFPEFQKLIADISSNLGEPPVEEQKRIEIARKAEEERKRSEVKAEVKPDTHDPALVKSFEVPSAQKTITNSIGMKLVLVPAGKFIMGSPQNEPGRKICEKQHEVIISRDFYLQTTPVSQDQWKRVMRDNPSRFKKYGHSCPVDGVSWDMAQQFIDKLNQMEDTFKYRLPTEAEWEYACRAGTTTVYSFGNKEGKIGEYAWYRDNADSQTHPVGNKKPSAWGLYDMHGNIWEWCQDWFGSYPTDMITDPIRLSNPNIIGGGFGLIGAAITLGGMVKKKLMSGRVCRGGSCISDAKFLRSAYRKGDTPIARNHDIGIRVAWNL